MPKRKPPTLDDIEAQLIKMGFIRDREVISIDPELFDLGSIDLSSIDLSLIPQLIADLDLTATNQALSEYLDSMPDINQLILEVENMPAIDFDRYLGGLVENFSEPENFLE
jgi:hypothetical protein